VFHPSRDFLHHKFINAGRPILPQMAQLVVDIGGRPGKDCRGFCQYCYFRHAKEVPPFGCCSQTRLLPLDPPVVLDLQHPWFGTPVVPCPMSTSK